MPTVETEMRRAHRKIRDSMDTMNSAKADLLEQITEARKQDYTLADIAKVLGISRSAAQKYVEAANDKVKVKVKVKA